MIGIVMAVMPTTPLADSAVSIPLRGELPRKCTIAVSAQQGTGLLVTLTRPLLGGQTRVETLVSISCNYPGASLLDLLRTSLGIEASALLQTQVSLLHLTAVGSTTAATFKVVTQPLLPLSGVGSLLQQAQADIGQVLVAVIAPN